MIKDRTNWHPAFSEALKASYRNYRDRLEFNVEHQLTTEPLRIDSIIIKI